MNHKSKSPSALFKVMNVSLHSPTKSTWVSMGHHP